MSMNKISRRGLFKASAMVGGGLMLKLSLPVNAMEGDAQKYIDLGVDDYVSKPLTMRSLKAVLKKWSLLLKG